MLNSDIDLLQYIKSKDAATLAKLLREDQDACRRGEIPSGLALYLPPANSEEAREICRHLQRENSVKVPLPVIRIQYAGIIQGIKAYLTKLDHTGNESPQQLHDEYGQVSSEDVKRTKEVLEDLMKSGHVRSETSLEEVLAVLGARSTYSDSPSSPPTKKVPKRQNRRCYMCHFIISTPHPLYPSLCDPCGGFNIAESSISLPQNLSLVGKTAFVTGGRVNLGYHTTLRLLRCGAKVIVSTRYPYDAEQRYLAEGDSPDWCDRLRILGADFRAAKDVFRIVSDIKDQLLLWSQEASSNESSVGKLDILINNAAQTLTDSLETETQAIETEKILQSQESNMVISSKYHARIRGSSNTPLLLDNTFTTAMKGGTAAKSMVTDDPISDNSIYKAPPKSSWMQTIHQIPYEDFVSAYSVNAFVPLILIRELLPLMGKPRSKKASTTSEGDDTVRYPHAPKSPSQSGPPPAAYILNISSREGIFEENFASPAKRGHHVHTNMSKASLNMITETEAIAAWHDRRVAMNTVDPGYMSAAPEIARGMERRGGEGKWNNACPIGWEDGAGRVLWPVATGERFGKVVWGRFLKHFMEVEVGM